MRFELVSINPGHIVGPNELNPYPKKFASGDLIKLLMENRLFALTKSKLGLIDIRDCARAHV